LIFYWWAVRPQWRSFTLIVLSIFLLLINSVFYTIVLFLLTIVIYLAGKAAAPPSSSKRKYITGFSIILIIVLFAYFKYWDELKILYDKLLALNIAGNTGLRKPVFFVGISYFTIKFLHFLSDSMRGKCSTIGFKDFVLYIFFFPIYTAGPIERIQKFVIQTGKELEGFKLKNLVVGIDRILIGLFKKLVIADLIATQTGSVFSSPHDYTSLRLWITLYLYSVQIYADFSGYTDIAIGSSKLFGYDISENFNRPYLKPNIALFWQSWHITLSNWLRDYIFLPLGKKLMSIKSSHKILIVAGISYFITMTVCGLWHGGKPNFILWGMYHGIGLFVFRIFQGIKGNFIPIENAILKKTGYYFSILITFNFVTFGWILFGVEFSKIGTYFMGMF